MGKHNNNTMQLVCSLATLDSQVALKSLYMVYFDRLMRFVTCHVGSEPVAEEIVSDTFLAVWENRKSLLEVTNFDSYIFTIARHKSISYFRANQMIKVEIDETVTDLFFQTDTTPEEDFISKETVDSLNNAINSLPDKCKMAFKLVREDKMKYKDAAQVLDISVKTLEAHITTAVKKIREALSKELE